MADDPANNRFAFLIGPDGDAGQALNAVIAKAVKGLGLDVRPWYDEPGPGTVTVTLVERLRDAAVVMADLRGANPNVYYEVGLAHGYRRPVVVFVSQGEDARFDLREFRALIVEIERGAIANKVELQQSIRDAVEAALEAGPATAVEFAELRRELPFLRSRLHELETKLSVPVISAGLTDVWRDLALIGRLPVLRRTDVRISVSVAHTEFGSGRIIAHSTLGETPMAVTVDFAAGRVGLEVPDQRLYLAEIQAVGNTGD